MGITLTGVAGQSQEECLGWRAGCKSQGDTMGNGGKPLKRPTGQLNLVASKSQQKEMLCIYLKKVKAQLGLERLSPLQRSSFMPLPWHQMKEKNEIKGKKDYS